MLFQRHVIVSSQLHVNFLPRYLVLFYVNFILHCNYWYIISENIDQHCPDTKRVALSLMVQLTHE